MEKLSGRGQKPNIKINELIEENESLKALLSDYTELKKFAEEVVEKHNELVNEYKVKQTELAELKEKEEQWETNLQEQEQELKEQKAINQKLEQRLVEFQNHINTLLDRFQTLEDVNKRQETTIDSLEKYIEIMDKAPKPIKNERGAGRKKKYNQEQIQKVLDERNKGLDYEKVVEIMNQTFVERQWEVKEIKYIYSRYKNEGK